MHWSVDQTKLRLPKQMCRDPVQTAAELMRRQGYCKHTMEKVVTRQPHEAYMPRNQEG